MIFFYIGLLVLVLLTACIGWRILMYSSKVIDRFIGNGAKDKISNGDLTLGLTEVMKSMKKYVYIVLGVLIGVGIVCAYVTYVLIQSPLIK